MSERIYGFLLSVNRLPVLKAWKLLDPQVPSLLICPTQFNPMRTRLVTLNLSIEKMMAWSPGLSIQQETSIEATCFEYFSEEKFSCKHISGIQGRRLSELTKTSVDLALRLTEGLEADHIIFSSRHGELVSSTQLLEMIGKKEVLSPTLFSQSVHNTAIGTYTLFKKSKKPTTALSGGRDSFIMGLISSQAYLSENPEHKVLYICADEKIPSIFAPGLLELNRAFAVAMIISTKNKGTHVLIESEKRESSEGASDQIPQGLEFLNWFCSQKTEIELKGHNLIWKLKKC